ncbi:hypothetical protein V8C44DRAFT_141905 [Trichoderma aethiopicum]
MDGCAWAMLLDRDHAGSELQRVLGMHCIGWAEHTFHLCNGPGIEYSWSRPLTCANVSLCRCLRIWAPSKTRSRVSAPTGSPRPSCQTLSHCYSPPSLDTPSPVVLTARTSPTPPRRSVLLRGWGTETEMARRDVLYVTFVSGASQ